MEQERFPVGRGATLFWVVPGLLAEGRRVAVGLSDLRPEVVALGVSSEEVAGLVDFVREPEEDGGWMGERFASALSRFGAVGFPPPAYLEATAHALEHGVPIRSVDLDEDAYDERYTKAVSTWQWWRQGRRMRRLEKRPPRARTAEEFVSAWDRRLRGAGKGILEVEHAREDAVAAGILDAATAGATAAVVDVTLRAGVTARLRTPRTSG